MPEIVAVAELTAGRGRLALPERYRVTYADGSEADAARHVEDPVWHDVLEWITRGGVLAPLGADRAA